jgi:predicted histone-like DNA-binding protein
MTIRVKLVNRKNPKVPTDPPKFYASAIHEHNVKMDELAIAVANRCTVRRADVHAVLFGLLDILSEELTRGNIVNLGQLGYFRVNVKSEGAETAEDYVPSMIVGKKIVYKPTKELKKLLQNIDISTAN